MALAATFDVLIVGAGTAGCVLANRLSADPRRRIGLIEAGGDVRDPDIADPARWPFLAGRDYDWDYRTIPQRGTNDRAHPWPRGRLLGGSSCLNAMAHVRGHSSDFDAWATCVASDRWSYEGLLPAFRRSETFSGGASDVRGADGPLDVRLPEAAALHPLVESFIAAGVSLGVPRLRDHNAGPLVGVAPNQLTIRDGRRVTAADAYLTPAMSRPNLTVVKHAEVARIEVAGGRVVGVGVKAGRDERRYVAETVVLAAGTLGSPLILMRSGVGDPDDLHAAGVACRVASRGVGRNLHDHLLAAGLVFRSRKPVAATRLQHSESLMYLHAAEPSRTTGAPDAVIACVVLPVVTERFPRPEVGQAYTLMCGFTQPESRGRIALTGSDPGDPPMIDPNYLGTEGDRRAFRASFRVARAVGHAAPLSAWREGEWLPGAEVQGDAEIDAFLADAAMTHHHPVGTCRMGTDPDAVTDERLKVRGLDNLYVVDASIIPRITTGPVNAAVTAIGEHWAARFAADFRDDPQ